MSSDKLGILEGIYDANLKITSSVTLGSLASEIVNLHRGKDMIVIIITQMFNEVSSEIRIEEDSRVHNRDWMEKLKAKKVHLENLLKLVNDL